MGTIASASEHRRALVQEANAQQFWYHTIELTPDLTTPGHVDLRRAARRILPRRLDGVRALDVGTYDGFWAFELEARNAGEVLATDLEAWDIGSWPLHTRLEHGGDFAASRPADRFRIAHDLLGSSVRHVECSIYDLDVERLGGPVHFALIGALLLHLRDPVRGLEATRRVIRPGGRLLVVEPFDVRGTLLHPRTPYARLRAPFTPWDWWLGNLAFLRHVLALAGFEPPRLRYVFRLDAVAEMRTWQLALEARAPGA